MQDGPELAGPSPGRRRLLVECMSRPEQASNPLSKCEDERACTVPGRHFVMSQTGLALLALQAAGNYESNEEKYSSQVRRGLDWLIEHQRPDGALVACPKSEPKEIIRIRIMYEHAMAAFALAEACAVRKAQGKAGRTEARSAAVKAIEFIERHQHNDGGWRYTINKQERSDCSVSGWAMLALKSAREAEIPVSQETVDQTRYFFKSCETSDGRTAYQSGDGAGLGRDHRRRNVDPPPVAQGSGSAAGEDVGKLTSPVRRERYRDRVRRGNRRVLHPLQRDTGDVSGRRRQLEPME